MSTIVAVFNNCCNVSPQERRPRDGLCSGLPLASEGLTGSPSALFVLTLAHFLVLFPFGLSSFTIDCTLETGNDATSPEEAMLKKYTSALTLTVSASTVTDGPLFNLTRKFIVLPFSLVLTRYSPKAYSRPPFRRDCRPERLECSTFAIADTT